MILDVTFEEFRGLLNRFNESEKHAAFLERENARLSATLMEMQRVADAARVPQQGGVNRMKLAVAETEKLRDNNRQLEAVAKILRSLLSQCRNENASLKQTMRDYGLLEVGVIEGAEVDENGNGEVIS